MGKMKVLIVDDEKKNLHAIRRIFIDHDYTLCFAPNGEIALEQVEKCSPSLVILDVMMPGIDGIEVCRRIKERNKNIMVLMLSAQSTLEDRMKGYSALADDYLVKPYDPEELKAKVKILLRLYNAKQALEDLNMNLELTVKKRTEEFILRERQALVGKMVQGIVHNLRGPIMVASNNTQLMTMQLDNFSKFVTSLDDSILQILNKVKKYNINSFEAMQKASNLIDTLLLQGGSNPKEKLMSLDLNQLIQKEYNFLHSEITMKHKTEVKLDLSDNLPLIDAKYTDFSQVFYNFVKNACEAMKNSDRKEITISTSYSSTGVILSFADTGPGVEPKKISRIFDPFFSSKSETDDTGSGSGLGLFISSRLMAEYHAFISVKNLKPCGIVFSIHIPLSNLYKGE
jgi:DNA-binding response OmpR family regulator